MANTENVVRDVIEKILKERKCKQTGIKINTVSSEGANYTSALYTITAVTDVENLELFAKVAIIAGEMRKHMNADWVYETERIFYTDIAKVYEALEDKHNVPKEDRFVFPKCYGFDSEVGRETVVMENLMAKGYKAYNRFEPMNWEYAAVSMEVLAKFHALSFAYERDYPEKFKEVATKMVYKASSSENRDETLVQVWMKMVETALSVIDEEHREKIRSMMMEENIATKYNKPIGRPVLIHGDYRLSNILFRREKDILEAIPVDYQLVHSGCPANDLIYFIYLGSDEQFRRQHYDQLLSHYYDHLCQALRRLHVDPVEVYSRETFDAHMKERLSYALLLGVVILPIVTVEAAAAPSMSEDGDLQSFVTKPNALYSSRFRGIVNDCVRMGIL